MFSRTFIDRPILASVLSIVITLAGGVAFFNLPIEQYPSIAPPTIEVRCNYSGASATVVAQTVASPIEQQINGVENMMYMSSQSTSEGAYSLLITFKLGTDLDEAQVLVQNRLSVAIPALPDVVRQTGVTTRKVSPSILLVVNLVSPSGEYDQLYLSNYATLQVRDTVARVDGVGDVILFGQQDYSMRVWLDPEKLASRNLTATDVVRALREQNIQVAAGSIAEPPVPPGRDFQYTVTTLGRLADAEQFENIILKVGVAGNLTRLRDVGRIELGARSVTQSNSVDGLPAIGIAIFQQPGANALATADRVRAAMDELQAGFPSGLEYRILYDTTPFVRESIREVIKTFLEAGIVVALVILLFLQSWRSTLIALSAIPVSIIGTFAVMTLLGFSLNTLTLFGLVLAIGIVVDDAIVVIENVERWIAAGLTPKEAAYRSMEEVSVAVVAIAFGLSAVFIPTAFLGGIPGQFFRQFALTIATSTLISAFNSLTLTPALAALVLRPHSAEKDWLARTLSLLLGWLFAGFNAVFRRGNARYAGLVRWCVRGSVLGLAVYGGMFFVGYRLLKTVPTGFIPDQDKGYVVVSVQLPDAASLERTQAVAKRVDEIIRATPGVTHSVAIAGLSVLQNAGGSNFATLFCILDEFHHRHDPKLSANAIAARLRTSFAEKIHEAQVVVFGAPPVEGIGRTGGFRLMIEDRADVGPDQLQAGLDAFVAKANQTPGLVGVFSMFRAATPQLYADIDRTKCKTMGIPLDDVFLALQAYLGGYYVNDFNRFGRVWQVIVQADAPFRLEPEDVGALKVRNPQGNMVPLGSLAEIRETSGPMIVSRYNLFPAAAVNGGTLPNISSGQMIQTVEKLARTELPPTLRLEWTDLTYMEILSGSTAMLIFPLCLLLVLLVHSAEYESWLLPLAIILIVPMSLVCALLGVWLVRLDNNLLTQIGFVVLAGLACKNAVLIVEFAKQERERGKSRHDAVVEAARVRLRPVLMTSLCFMIGVLPLVFSQGAGAELRHTLGVAVFSGMLGVTFFGLFLTPVFYNVLQKLADRRNANEPSSMIEGGETSTPPKQ